MEVSGRKDFSSGDSSNAFCQPCENDGQHSEAEGFCKTCKEYLCITCITHHRKVTLSKNHVILDKRNMPAYAPRQPLSPICTELCEKHSTEVVKFFCKQHETIGCGDCMVLEHKACKVDYIPEISEAFLAGTEFTTLVKTIRRLQSIVKSASDENVKNENEAAKAYTETVNDIRTFRKDINDYLDRMEEQLLERCDSIKQENGTVIQKISNDLQIRVCQLKRSQTINDVVSKCSPLAEIEFRNSTELTRGTKGIINLKPETEGFIDVRTTSDQKECYISSIVALNDTKLACTDWFNKKVKLIDTTQGTLISEEAVELQPWDLCLVPNEEIAVTLYTVRKIQFLSFKKGLKKSRFIKVNGECRGIDYSKERLFVSYEKNSRVEILTLQGNVLRCFKTDCMGGASFKRPLYVVVGGNEEYMYVSDDKAKSVIKLTFEGQILATYSDQTLVDPGKPAALGNGYILVPNGLNRNVLLISPDGQTLKIFETNDVPCVSLCYDEDAYKLYIGSESNRIQIYKLK